MPMKPPSFRPPRAWGGAADDRAYNALRRSQDADLAQADRLRHTARWRRVRARVLAEHPTCVACLARGRVRPATQVDHVVPLVQAPELAYEPTNLQGLCTRCHAVKSQQERRGAQAGARGATESEVGGGGGADPGGGEIPPTGARERGALPERDFSRVSPPPGGPGVGG